MVDTIQQENEVLNFKPQKFVIWLFVVSSTIMFGGFTSYYLVFMAQKGKGHGLVLPDVFIYSSVVIVLSSIFLVLANKALRKGDTKQQRLFLWLTFAMGLAFAILQYQGWVSLYQTGAVLVNNNAAISMIYIVSGLHLLHIFAGLCIVINSIVGNYRNVSQPVALYRQEITSIFWHFIDILWIYLYVFLLLNS